MSVRIRLQRRGSTKRPTYAIVAADARMARDGRCLEKLGTYDPRQEQNGTVFNHERVNYWLSVGAQPSDRVAKLLKNATTLTA
ncbi:MAG: 30S ribosomal protein S16 [Magnetococcus sp. DMHC-6]